MGEIGHDRHSLFSVTEPECTVWVGVPFQKLKKWPLAVTEQEVNNGNTVKEYCLIF